MAEHELRRADPPNIQRLLRWVDDTPLDEDEIDPPEPPDHENDLPQREVTWGYEPGCWGTGDRG